MLDETTSPCPCSTPPTNPLFDGEKYYFLPWGNFKPYVQIDCQWEDITFRLGTLNRLLRICKRLVSDNSLFEQHSGVHNDKNNRLFVMHHDCQTNLLSELLLRKRRDSSEQLSQLSHRILQILNQKSNSSIFCPNFSRPLFCLQSVLVLRIFVCGDLSCHKALRFILNVPKYIMDCCSS